MCFLIRTFFINQSARLSFYTRGPDGLTLLNWPFKTHTSKLNRAIIRIRSIPDEQIIATSVVLHLKTEFFHKLHTHTPFWFKTQIFNFLRTMLNLRGPCWNCHHFCSSTLRRTARPSPPSRCLLPLRNSFRGRRCRRRWWTNCCRSRMGRCRRCHRPPCCRGCLG